MLDSERGRHGVKAINLRADFGVIPTAEGGVA